MHAQLILVQNFLSSEFFPVVLLYRMFVSAPNSYVEILTLNVMVGGEPLGDDLIMRVEPS